MSDKGDDVILEGEATGHAHRLTGGGRVLVDDVGTLFVRALAYSALVHEEHRRIDLPDGYYRVIRQREFVPRADLVASMPDLGQYRYVED